MEKGNPHKVKCSRRLRREDLIETLARVERVTQGNKRKSTPRPSQLQQDPPRSPLHLPVQSNE